MKPFRPVRSPFGGIDTFATQDAFIEYVGGTARAETLSRLYNESHPTGTAYDKLMGRGRTREDNFRIKAQRQGFTSAEVDAYLSL